MKEQKKAQIKVGRGREFTRIKDFDVNTINAQFYE